MNAIKEFQDYMKLIGASKQEKAWSDLQYQVETIYGTLRISIHDDDFTKNGKPRRKHHNLSSIYCSFQDKRCEEYLSKYYSERKCCNWKWNFHSSSNDGGNELDNWKYNFYHFQYELERILVKNEITA